MTATSTNTLTDRPSDKNDLTKTGQYSADHWYQLIDEKVAAQYLGLKPRTLQDWRQRSSSGPPFVRISGRCIKYRRIDLREWADARLRKSTSDMGSDAA